MTIKTKNAKVILEEDNASNSSESDNEVETNFSEQDSETEVIDDESKAMLNEAWADSIAKILNTKKPKGKKSLVLSKAKKLNDPKKIKKPESYEIATSDGQVKREVTEEVIQPDVQPKKKRRELPNLRVKPNILQRTRERTLQKIATKGVVQLFNAVKNQQKDIGRQLDEAGPLEVHKEKVLKNIDKRAFLDVLMGEKSDNVQERTIIPKKKTSEPSWNVLRDDFMMSAKMKDWDKELETEDNVEEVQNVEFN